ncbi:DUF2971 domain-containing protein [Vibrio vulnificus]|nr:DUF2971 domain-containing protein [Vibrio vulnificus]MCU8365560.1 DUF2971 domain-containing protein [Vibrio vulnificus]MCU8369732.1 DUF2971 domain-containing protein [Vibrio vulnificus]HAS8380375.1 DUF2971 domain-containing protein [Vibrio vulnificus]
MYKFTAFRESFFSDRKVRMTQPSLFNDPFESAINSSVASAMWLKELKRWGVGDEEYMVNYLRQYSVIDPSISVLSLTESSNNLLMWAHYANEHKGIIIEVDISHEFFNSKSHGFSGKCFKIRYTNERLNTNDYLRNNLGLPPGNLLKKSNEWAYEKEVRFFLTKDQVEVSNDNAELWLCSLPINSIKSIIIGVRANKWHIIYHFFKALLSGSFPQHTELHLARLKNDTYEIEYVPFCDAKEICSILDRHQVTTLLSQLEYIHAEPLKVVSSINVAYAQTLQYMLET